MLSKYIINSIANKFNTIKLFNIFLIFFLVLIVSSCHKTREPKQEQPTTKNTTDLSDATATSIDITLLADVDVLQVRKNAGLDAEVIVSLVRGESMQFLGTISNFTTKIELGGIKQDEPWLLVELSDGRKGWVYAGSVRHQPDDKNGFSNLLLQKRLNSFFGNITSAKIQRHRRNFHRLTTSEGFARAYAVALELRDTLVVRLNQKINLSESETVPDLYWLEECLPGFVVQIVAEGTRYHLFVDYREWGQKAAETSGIEDDHFMEICYASYPTDSIEYVYKGWFQQTWEHGGSSLLGKGIHKKMFDDLEKMTQLTTLFANDLATTKRELLDDILNENNTYWEAKDKILAELEEIMATNYTILTKEDRIAIKERYNMFKDYKTHRIQLNLRAGTVWN